MAFDGNRFGKLHQDAPGGFSKGKPLGRKGAAARIKQGITRRIDKVDSNAIGLTGEDDIVAGRNKARLLTERRKQASGSGVGFISC